MPYCKIDLVMKVSILKRKVEGMVYKMYKSVLKPGQVRVIRVRLGSSGSDLLYKL